MTTLEAFATVPLVVRRAVPAADACRAMARLNKLVKTDSAAKHSVYALKARLTRALYHAGYCAGVRLDWDANGDAPQQVYGFMFHVSGARVGWHQLTDDVDWPVALRPERLPLPPMMRIGAGEGVAADFATIRRFLRGIGG